MTELNISGLMDAMLSDKQQLAETEKHWGEFVAHVFPPWKMERMRKDCDDALMEMFGWGDYIKENNSNGES